MPPGRPAQTGRSCQHSIPKDGEWQTAFEAAFHSAIDMANAYHELKEKPYIRWKLPDAPPPDMDLTPRGGAKK